MIVNIQNPGVIAKTNWDQVRQSFAVIWEEISSGRWDGRKTHDPHMRANVYSMPRDGITVSSTTNKFLWKLWNGEWFESLLPWSAGFRSVMANAGLPVSSITYHIHSDSIPEHKDVAYFGEFPDRHHSNINFVISSLSPDESYTWCRDDAGNEMRYYSYPNKLWLMNASNLHAVECNSLREGLIIKLRQPYDAVNEFLQKNPNLFDENQPHFKL